MKKSILNKGNQARIAKVLQKALSGEDITVVTIGGSITSGAWATSDENKYAVRVKNWFVEQFPNITVNFQNAGISATPSLIGVHRVAEQVLSFDPDFVVVDFTVNENVAAGTTVSISAGNVVLNKFFEEGVFLVCQEIIEANTTSYKDFFYAGKFTQFP